ncbi:hypothetical protein B0H63DRAFT_537059 [Podospora didyma]|uniref:Uncharacterized protein n=1 Tax=Podospora didyma TaxID=330526 RepID=A0AAE0U351_9PEZI|nr:hypothetical protein B0H63DRAFT_537059 [Podospora didyma]
MSVTDAGGITSPYTKAEALMIGWEDGNRINQEAERPHRTLVQKPNEFLEVDAEDTLLVAYYGGHGVKNDDNQLVWLRDEPGNSKNPELRGIPQVNWSALQTLFLLDCTSPVLFLIDCCYAGAVAHFHRSSNMAEALVATGFHDVAPVRAKDSFTVLTKALYKERELGRELHIPYLKTLVSAMLNNASLLDARGDNRRVTPDYLSFTREARFITLRVLEERKALTKTRSPSRQNPPASDLSSLVANRGTGGTSAPL